MSPLDSGGDGVRIVPVDALGAPAGGFEALHLVHRIGERQRPVDRDAIIVVEHDEARQLQVARERYGLLRDTFHQVAVGRQHVGMVVDDAGAELRRHHPLAEREADRGRDALAERACRGLDAFGVAVFGMARRLGAPLAEALQLVERHARRAREIEQRVEQHRAVAGGQDEAVAVGPARRGGIELQVAREQHRRDVGRAHGQAGMAGLGLLHAVHREAADGVGEGVMLLAGNHHRCPGSGGGATDSTSPPRVMRPDNDNREKPAPQ